MSLGVLLGKQLVRRPTHSVSFRKGTCLHHKLTVMKRKSASKVFSQVGLRVKHSSFSVYLDEMVDVN